MVSGFYDPGVLSAGMRPILMDQEVVHYINSSSQSSICDQNMVNGIRVWSPRLNHTEEIYRKLIDAFKEKDLLPYWQVTPYYEYEFAKDFLLQFQSDKYLFTIVGILILIVACCNIISLLIILIHHKKKEIAILRAIGATKRSIAYIFTLCGGIIGLISTLIGTLGAMLTLHYIHHVIRFLSILQGREALNPLFFGVTLPNHLSMQALLFVCIAAPLFSLVVAFVPAYKACRLLPSPILQSGD